jgi:glycosyltransferase involved in cell wall biosynthesis
MKTFLVIVPLYNKTKYLPYSIPSILNQKDVFVEVVIVDDASTDGGFNWLVDNFNNHGNIHLLQNKENIGCFQTRNRGLKYAIDNNIHFDYWVVHDPDDQSSAGRFSKAEWLFNKREGVLFLKQSYMRVHSPSGSVKEHSRAGEGCAFIHRKVFDMIGYYDNTLRFGGDTEYMWRFGRYITLQGKDPNYYTATLPDYDDMFAFYDDEGTNLTIQHPIGGPERLEVSAYIDRMNINTNNPQLLKYGFTNKGCTW